ncbi:MAG: helix-turn-helix transcriptional regulator [Oscillospiraceae bacterium]|nr:helix-turn-helix transcriptional regulator [Oscillospiraceae bacterium]
MDIKKMIGMRINSSLARCDMLQKDLAKVLGVQDNTISYYCKGVRGPQLEQLPKIAETLNTTTDYLLGITDDPGIQKTAVDDLGLSPKAIEWIEKLDKKAPCIDHDDRIYVLNYLLENINFQLFFYNLCEFYYSSRAEAIYNYLFDLAFPQMEGDEDFVTQDMGDKFRTKIHHILEAHSIPNEIRDYLAATNDLWSRQNLGDSRLVDVLMGAEGFNVSDLPEFRVNRDFSSLMESIRHHAVEKGTLGILPEDVIEPMR